jgi:hypothetical protein
VRGRGRQVAWAVAGAACITLAVATVGLPGTLLLGSGWLMAAGISLAVPALSGPASWAAAIVVEIALLTGLSAASALISPGPQSRAASLAILASPGFLGAILGFAAPRHNRQPRILVPSETGGIALAVVAVGLAIARWVASLGRDYGVAWAMSGDVRNETFVMRSVIQDGGLTVQRLRTYPALVNDLMALISAGGRRTRLRPGDLLLHDAHAVATVYVTAAIAISLMLMAALLETMRCELGSSSDGISLSALVVLLAGAITSVSPLVLGTALVGGFVDGYATLPVVIGAIVIALRFCRAPSPLTLVLLGLATVVTFLSWPILAFVPGALLAVVGCLILGRSVRQRAPFATWVWVLASTVGLSMLVVVLAVSVVEAGTLRGEFLRSGHIILPQTGLLYLAGFLAVGVALAVKDRVRHLQMGLVLVIVTVGSIVIRWLTDLPPGGHAWTYDATKALWLAASSLVWLGFVPVLLSLEPATAPPKHERRWRSEVLILTRAAAWCGVVLVLLGFTTIVPDVLPSVRGGWYEPSAGVVANVVAEANTSQRFVFWEWTDWGDEILANRWAALAWDSTARGTAVPYPPELPRGFVQWAAAETGALSQLCAVTEGVPQLVVITADPSLPKQLRAACPHNKARMVVTYSTSLKPRDTEGH